MLRNYLTRSLMVCFCLLLTGNCLAQQDFQRTQEDDNRDQSQQLVNLPDQLLDGLGDDQSAGGNYYGSYEFELSYPYAPLKEYADVCELFPPPATTTKLFLNFAGNSNKGVSVFEANTDSREADIQEIMFRTSQVFAPFDVQVKEFIENGQKANSGGHSTVFIGDRFKNTIVTGADSSTFLDNRTRATGELDRPTPLTNFFYQPNSSPADAGYVDPISFTKAFGNPIQNWNSWGNETIARVIAHEAGHTFGLAHVLTDGTPDIMSYNSASFRFVNVPFPITSLNSQLDGPTEEDPLLVTYWTYKKKNSAGDYFFNPVPLETQNSYRVLAANLGLKDTDNDIANVANLDYVPAIYMDAQPMSIESGEFIPSQIDTYGDYDVFDFTPNETWNFSVEAAVTNADDEWFDPIVMVFDGNGEQLLAYDRNSGEGKDARLQFTGQQGQSYKIVVGSRSNNTFGGYQLKVSDMQVQVSPWVPSGTNGGTYQDPTNDDDSAVFESPADNSSGMMMSNGTGR